MLLSNTLTLAALLSPTAASLSTFPAEALHNLLSRQTSSYDDKNACQNGIISSCSGSNPSESACKNAACSNSCFSFISGLKTCCDSTSSFSDFSKCLDDKLRNGGLSANPITAAATVTRSTTTTITTGGSTTTSTGLVTSTLSYDLLSPQPRPVNTGGAERLEAGQMGLVGSAFAWALGLLLL